MSEARLAAHDATLLVSTMDLQSGRLEILRYPGSDVPLVDGLMAAVATCGLTAPLPRDGHQLAEGTFLDSLLVGEALATPAEEVVVVAPVGGASATPVRTYRTWRAVLERALAINQAHDVRQGVELAERTAAAAEAFRRVSRLAQRLPELAPPEVRDRVAADIAAVYAGASFPLRRALGPAVVHLTPDLGYPMWRFRPDELRAAVVRGEREARTALARP